MDPNNSNIGNDTNREVQIPNNSKFGSIPKTRNLLIATVIIIVIILPVLFLSVKSVKEKKPMVNPTEAPKPTLLPFPSKGDYVGNQLIVEYKEGMSPDELRDNNQRSQLASDLQELGVISQKKLYESTDPKLKNFYILTLKEGIDAKGVSNKIYSIPQIKGVEPNGKVGIFK